MKKKLIAGFLVLFLIAGIFSGPVTVNASSITGTEGSLTIEKTDKSGQPLEDVGFTLYKIVDLTPGTSSGQYATYTPVSHYSSVVTASMADEFGNYSASQIEALVDQLLLLIESDSNAIPMTATDSAGETKKDNLGLGYYLVVETSAPAGYITGRPFFVAIPSMNTTGNGWEYNVKVMPKNESITLEKQIVTGKDAGKDVLDSTTTAKIGETVSFVIDTAIPSFDEAYFESPNKAVFKLTDTMSEGLDFKDDTKIFIVDNGGTETEVSSANYTVTPGGNSDPFTFEITFEQDFLKANRGKDIRVRYSAELNSDAVLGTSGNNNEVELEYSNNPNNLTETDQKVDESNIYTFGIEVEKFNEDGNALVGVTFGLYTDAACTVPVFNPATGTTATGGLLLFKGLQPGTYYLKETATLSGYRLLANPIKIEITAKSGSDGELDGTFELKVGDTLITETSGTQITRIEKDGIATIAIENTRGFTLPATGGMGVTIFLIIGLSGVVLLSVMMIKKKKSL